jgi:transcriptional regulator with XRE-family HTH domain
MTTEMVARASRAQPLDAEVAPWGAAIRYWLRQKHLTQRDIVTATGMQANKISRAARGCDVRMSTLRHIAAFLRVPLEQVLVSPEYMSTMGERRAIAQEVIDRLTRFIGDERDAPPVEPAGPGDRMVAIAHRLERLPPPMKKSVVDLIRQYERAAAQATTTTK